MALSTRSKFFYGYDISTSNRYIDFFDGANTVQAVLGIGSYSSSELASEISNKMSSVAGITFTCTFNRSTRKFTISAGSNFNLLFSTGSQAGQSVAATIGFSSSDKTAASSYSSDIASGSEYVTQFIPQSYKPTSTNRKSIDGVVNKSASGVVEVVKYGNERFMELELLFITNIQQEIGSIITSNHQGLEEYTAFIENAVEKRKIEFMPDYTDVETYQVFILESTEASQDGLDYEVIEMYDRGLAGYYRSGKLKFRLQE